MSDTHTTDADDDAAYHAARGALYNAAGAPFLYPDGSLVADFTDPEARSALETAAERVGLVEEVEALLSALSEADLERLQAEHTELFGLPSDGGEYAVVPYEAHYTTRDEVGAEQRRIAQVVGLMEQVGVTPGDEFAERQDHVAAELELMQVLAAQRAMAVEDGDADAAERVAEAEATTLATHLVEFVPTLAHEVEGATDHPVFRAAADLAAELVKLDHDRHPAVDVPEPDPSGAVAGGGEL